MSRPPRHQAFILASTDQGTLIVNRHDYKMVSATDGFGVGHMLLSTGSYDATEVALGERLLLLRREYHGPGVVAVDCGANIGVLTVEWAKAMTGWGSVLAIEAQERIFYALAGNIAINNCFNARALLAAVTREPGTMRIPVPDYTRPATFGSLELRPSETTEDIGQPVDYDPNRMQSVQAVSIDSLALPRLDLLKVDVEGMEMEVLNGAEQTIGRFLPLIIVEHLKTSHAELDMMLSSHGYRRYQAGLNIVAVHPSDPSSGHISFQPAAPPGA